MKQKMTKTVTDTVEVDNQRIALVNCERLNIRSSASMINENIIGTAIRNEVLIVDLNDSTDEFYKVTSESGLDGYCRIEFVKLTV